MWGNIGDKKTIGKSPCFFLRLVVLVARKLFEILIYLFGFSLQIFDFCENYLKSNNRVQPLPMLGNQKWSASYKPWCVFTLTLIDLFYFTNHLVKGFHSWRRIWIYGCYDPLVWWKSFIMFAFFEMWEHKPGGVKSGRANCNNSQLIRPRLLSVLQCCSANGGGLPGLS